jgi:hypothetical protein
MTNVRFPPNRIRPQPGLLGGFPKGVADRERLAEMLRMQASGATQAEIGRQFHISRQRVGKIFDTAKSEGVALPPDLPVGSHLSRSDSRPSTSPDDDAADVEQEIEG